MMNIEGLRRRLESLKAAFPEPEPWPPTEGSFSHCLWAALGKPGERRGFMEMYQQRATDFWRDQNENR